MPPRKKAAQTLSAHIDVSSDEDAGAQEAKIGSVPQKKTLAKRAPRKASTTTEKKASIARGKKKVTTPTEDEEVDDPIEDEDMGDTVVVNDEPDAETKKRGRKTSAKPEPAKKEPTKKGKGKGKRAVAGDLESEEDGDEQEQLEKTEGESIVGEPKAVKRGGKAAIAEAKDTLSAPAPEKKKRMSKKEKDAAKEEAEKEIAETQLTPMELDPPSDNETEDDQELEIAPTPTQVHQAGIKKKTTGKKVAVKGKGKKEEHGTEDELHTEEDELAKPTRVIAPAAPPGRGKGKRQVSTGDGEKGESLKDLEKAYEELQMRYNKLQEAKETEPERALREFRKNMKEKDEERNKFIAALQEDLKAQQALSGESKSLQKKLAAKETEVSKLQAKVQELNKSLQDQHNESQLMSAKLAQAQHQLVQAQNQRNNTQVPGSAVKPSHRGGPLGNPKTNLSTAADDAKVKEDLYADLSGLIIVNVKKENDSNVFECLQTGVNGLAFHFKLSVPNQRTKSKKVLGTHEGKDPADTDEIDENEIIFIPLFNETRDKSVINLLPEYLRDEISFQRDHMTKFYQKINSLFMMTISAQNQASESSEEEEEESDDDEEEEGMEEEDDDDMEVEK